MEPRISLFSNAKQLKLSCQLTDNNGDRISSLPDPVLHHILSFLDIKHVIQTSLLSRRWRYLWTSLSTLNFNAQLFVSTEETPGFNDFVDRVLLLRDGSNIESFRLICDDSSVANRLNTWILVALRHNVRKLCFDISVNQIPPLPSCLFTCKSLTKLRLNTSGMEFSQFVLPDSMSLPALKVLLLESFTLDDENSFHKLFSSCPLLEWLYISDCKVEMMNLNISSPNLKYFRLEIYHQGVCYSYLTEGKINLCAPNLINLIIADYISKDYSLENLSSLETADIHMGREVEDYDESELPLEMKELYAQRMMRYLRALHNVKELTVSALFLEKSVKDPLNPIYPYLDEINFDSSLEKLKVVVLPSNEESTVKASRMIKFSETLLKFPRASSSIAILFFS